MVIVHYRQHPLDDLIVKHWWEADVRAPAEAAAMREVRLGRRRQSRTLRELPWSPSNWGIKKSSRAAARRCCRLVESVRISESRRQICLGGVVHIIELKGHPTASRAYAWSSPIEGSTERQFFAVLNIPLITSPVEAVRATVMRKGREMPLCNDNFYGRPTTIGLICHCRRRMRGFARNAAVTSRARLAALKPLAQDGRACGIDAMDLKHVLGQILSNRCHLLHGWLTVSGNLRRPPFWHSDAVRGPSTPSVRLGHYRRLFAHELQI